VAWLPTIKIAGLEDPVVQVIDEADGQPVYTIRIKGSEFRPKVFREGIYTIRVGRHPGAMKEFQGIRSLAADETKTLEVDLD